MTPEEIGAIYRERNGTSVIQLGDAMLACRRELGISQQEMARRAHITPGTCHHHESVSLSTMRGDVESGKLAFKEARALADVGFHHGRNFQPDERLPEIVALFTSGRLSSVYVEAIVRAAKQNPAAQVDELVKIAFANVKKVPASWQPPKAHAKPAVSTKDLQAHILALAGEIEAWGMGEHSEVERLPVLAAARVLCDRLRHAGLAATPANDAPVASAGVGNRRLALLLEEPRKVLNGQAGLALG